MDRTRSYFRYLIDVGCIRRYGWDWWTQERQDRIEYERGVIEEQGFEAYFVILARVMQMCRDEGIPYGPGRGSVGGSLVCYLMGIHEVDPLEWDLLFERFMNPDRVSYPDVDIDVSQRDRPRVLEWVQKTFGIDGNTVLQVAALARMGGRAAVDAVASAMEQTDPQARAIAETLKKCFPKGNITGGTKQERELAFWLDKGHGDKKGFRELAEKAGWMEHLLAIDGLYSHLAKHAAGVVILNEEDVAKLPLCSADGTSMLTGFDMYSLDKLGYLKYDFLGLRTLDIVCDADLMSGGTGLIPDMLEIWKEHRDDPAPYQMLTEADTLGVFQVDTPGYQGVLRAYEPRDFNDLVKLTALYRPGALDYVREEDGKNMVEVFIDRKHNREHPTPPHPDLHGILSQTFGIMLYQEQLMQVTRTMAGFTMAQADALRSAVGKKRMKEMQALRPKFYEGAKGNGYEESVIDRVWLNIEAAARYSWNKSHAVFYAIITWWTAWYKATQPAAYYCALLNSFDKDKQEKIAGALAEAREHAEIDPPDINVAQTDFVVNEGRIVFGLNGVKGMGEAYRAALLVERLMGGDFEDFEDFARRVGGSVPVNMKLALIKCGAFDKTDDRRFLLSQCFKWKSEKTWTVAEHINHNAKLKKPRPVPDIFDLVAPDDKALAQGELDAIGFYISTTPMKEIGKALARCPKANTRGGEITGIRTKDDKNGNEMAWFTLITPSLERQRCMMFASNYQNYSALIEKGRQVLVRGEFEGSQMKVSAIWEPDQVSHFSHMKVSKNGDPEEQMKVDSLEQILGLERAGYRVRLL